MCSLATASCSKQDKPHKVSEDTCGLCGLPEGTEFLVRQYSCPSEFLGFGSRHPSDNWRVEIIGSASVPVHDFANDFEGFVSHNWASFILDLVKEANYFRSPNVSDGARAK